MAFIIVAGICACLYFLFLCFMVFQVFRNISGKRSSLPAMSKARRLHYEVGVTASPSNFQIQSDGIDKIYGYGLK